MDIYKHGSYGELGSDIITDVSEALEAGVVYIGTAPLNLVKGYSSDYINKPVLISSLKEAKEIFGYSSKWEQYTLCEAIKVHFGNTSGNVGPVIFINVLDPSVHIASTKKTGTLTFTNKRATITDSLMIVDSFALDGKTEGTDYTVSYDYNKGQLVISDISEKGISTNTYEYSDISMPFETMKSEVIGSITSSGQVKGINALKLVYQNTGIIPRKVLAPYFSSHPDVYEKINEIARSINGRFIAQDYVDIPVVDEDGNAIDTIAKAKEWAKSNDYSSQFSKIFYPMAEYNGEKYHLSTLFAARQMLVDESNDGVPFETASNKVTNIDNLYFGDSALNSGIDIEDANTLNAAGITTAVYYGGNWRLWGGHTAAYNYKNEDELGKEIFDTSIAMQIYLADDFINRYANLIDTPMTVGLIQSIVNEEQSILDNLVSTGALIGSPKFVADDVGISEIKSGSYKWILQDTPTSQFKDATITVVYTDEGYAALLGGSEEDE